MQSTKFGGVSWKAMFYVAAGYDLNESPKHVKDPQYANFFKSWGDVLPCKYCRDSYVGFYNSLDIYRYMKMPSCGLIRFVYDLKSLVNKKLENQEHKALKEEFDNLRKDVSPDNPKFWEIFREKAHNICYTKPAPPFEEVVENLMKDRASCSAKMKTCRNPLVPKFPAVTQNAFADPNTTGVLDRDLYKGGRRKSVSRRKR